MSGLCVHIVMQWSQRLTSHGLGNRMKVVGRSKAKKRGKKRDWALKTKRTGKKNPRHLHMKMDKPQSIPHWWPIFYIGYVKIVSLTVLHQLLPSFLQNCSQIYKLSIELYDRLRFPYVRSSRYCRHNREKASSIMLLSFLHIHISLFTIENQTK